MSESAESKYQHPSRPADALAVSGMLTASHLRARPKLVLSTLRFSGLSFHGLNAITALARTEEEAEAESPRLELGDLHAKR